jgi:hypothetical protein
VGRGIQKVKAFASRKISEFSEVAIDFPGAYRRPAAVGSILSRAEHYLSQLLETRFDRQKQDQIKLPPG